MAEKKNFFFFFYEKFYCSGTISRYLKLTDFDKNYVSHDSADFFLSGGDNYFHAKPKRAKQTKPCDVLGFYPLDTTRATL